MPTGNFRTQFPNYEVLAQLAEGNPHVVKARHLPSGDLVIIKEYALTADADTRLRIEQESPKMIEIDHPNLVRVREVQMMATMTYIVLDFVEAGNLRSLLSEEDHLDVPTTIRLGLQVTGAFRAMHARHLIHRAINPETILYRRLVSGELHFLLSDLGTANFRADDPVRNLTDESLMSYAYAAPEQFDKLHQVGEAVDYYALGVVLYECLTGKVPFVPHTERELIPFMQHVLTAPMPEFTTASGQPLPPSLATLFLCLLTRNPQDRLGNVDQLELLLEQSRVEYLNATWSAPNEPKSVTVADPLTPVVNTGGGVNEPVDKRTKHAIRRKRTWWVEVGIIVAAGLAFGLYSRTGHQVPNEPPVQTDSKSEKRPERDKPGTKSAAVMPITREEKEPNTRKNTEVDTVSEVSIEPVYQPKSPADSAAKDTPIVDSTAVIPPDSAR